MQGKQVKKFWKILGYVCVLAMPGSASIFTVDSSGDMPDLAAGDGVCESSSDGCTLRAAIEEANALAGADSIHFGIPGSGVHLIQPETNLPVINAPVTLDGYSQPGAKPNTRVVGNDAVLRVEINGARIPASDTSDGLVVTGDGNKIRGLCITGFNRDFNSSNRGGIVLLRAGRTVVIGNFIGVAPDGQSVRANDISGIAVVSDSPSFSLDNRIGGASPAERNVISGNGGAGIALLNSQGTHITGNYIGTDATGTKALGNRAGGVISSQSPDTVIGVGIGATGAGNLISGNGSTGVLVRGAGNVRVAGNIIGLNTAGTEALGNSSGGVRFERVSRGLIGGLTATERNLVSGNKVSNISIVDSSEIGVQGNFIGPFATGITAPENFSGATLIGADSCLIGGAENGARNIISGNRFAVSFENSNSGLDRAARGNRVQGNWIGMGATGQPLGNQVTGITLATTDNTLSPRPLDNQVGGRLKGEGNVIAFNGGAGVQVIQGEGNAIQGNAIYANGSLGIALRSGSDDLVLLNDTGDIDTGRFPFRLGNKGQNYPVLSGARIENGLTLIEGALNSKPNQNYRIEFFASSDPDPSGYGEGQQFLGALVVRTDANGDAEFSKTAPRVPYGQVLSATATDGAGNTSEFARALPLIAPGSSLVVTNNHDRGPGSLRAAILVANGLPGHNTITFSIPGSGVHTLAPLTPLPALTQSVTIDGYSQPGSQPNSLVRGSNARPLIEISGSRLGPEFALPPATNGAGNYGTSGLRLVESQCTLRGLVINRFPGHGVLGELASQRIEGCFVGTDAAGRTAVGNLLNGIWLKNGDSTVGGSLAARNVISGNEVAGLWINGAGSRVFGNLIGTDLTGTRAVGNGTSADERRKGPAVSISGFDHFIGEAGAGNVISGNVNEGLAITGDAITVRGNFIGTRADGIGPLGNGGDGVKIWQLSSEVLSEGISIGGSRFGQGNVIAFNGGQGIAKSGDTVSCLSNAIFSNRGLGIDTPQNGVTGLPNSNSSGNFVAAQNYPVLTEASVQDNKIQIVVKLSSRARERFAVQLFASPTVDRTGYGEGHRLLNTLNVETDDKGEARMVAFVFEELSGQFITATATNLAGNTSEFSKALLVAALTPSQASRQIGQPHTVILSLKQAGSVLPNTRVLFSIVSGPNAGRHKSVLTNANGQATFTYTGSSAGVDTVRVTGEIGRAGFAANASVNWSLLRSRSSK